MDNPNAFPTTHYGAGMTLRDYFAGQALVGIFANPNGTAGSWQVAAKHAYLSADAMLAERTKEQSNG
jgi:hypothetical protein